ncbi:hypothetical protein [Corynebacterium callunae]|uniref:Lipoprotein n=1 Tax=Corynebacterium callunae DSM 20147 TaxID=1121353 RepID=M1UIQ7_9CORY|nr:hypothetical protein [Corynebacterium callunae]AGG65624.1 hypothetical protein H924_00830 [Corynebacterium callunae DSM 20147]
MKNTRLMAAISVLLTVIGLVSAVPANAIELADAIPERTQIVIVYDDGTIVASENADESRPALSLAKLYLGYYVLEEGDEEDAVLVYDMIRYSQDSTADYLESIYPEAIEEIVDEFDLRDTDWAGYWGNSTTSMLDMAEFVSKVNDDPTAAPLIDGMANTAEEAADGYAQDFGTITLPDMLGTKLGWSDNLDVHASVSIGSDFVVAANTYGDADTLTEDVQDYLSEDSPEVTTPAIANSYAGNTVSVVESAKQMKTAADVKDELAGTIKAEALSLVPDALPIPNFIYRLLIL